MLLLSPFNWSEEYTDKANWLGGTYKEGAPVRCEVFTVCRNACVHQHG